MILENERVIDALIEIVGINFDRERTIMFAVNKLYF